MSAVATKPHPATSDAEQLNGELLALDAAQRIQVIAERFPSTAMATTSFGAHSAVMLHLLKEHAPELPIVFIDTGYLFPETYQFSEQLWKKWDLNIKLYQPRYSASRLEALYGKLWEQGEEGAAKYGVLTKVEPMNRAIEELGGKVWLSGLRRAQSQSRAERQVVEQQKATLKVYPIIDWTDDEVDDYMRAHELPHHPLYHKGYVSIGDIHSTKPLEKGMTPEQTRFDGEKRECGLHEPSEFQDFSI